LASVTQSTLEKPCRDCRTPNSGDHS